MDDDLKQLLSDLAEYFEDKADADFNGEKFVPNEEMRLLERIENLQDEKLRIHRS